jgi:uncharacterized surface protein with fasciclin (FAS1) repeats
MLAIRIAIVTLLAANVLSRTLDEALGEHEELSAFREMISEFPNLLSDLDTDGDVTILAPSDNAFSEYSGAIESAFVSNETISPRQLLNYHILNGRYHTDEIPARGAFYPTFLTDAQYSTVRHGQVVYGKPSHPKADQVSGYFEFYSGWNNVSATLNEGTDLLNIEFDRGLIHLISRPLTIPPTVEDLILLHPDTYAYSDFHSKLRNFRLGQGRPGSDVTFFVPTTEAFSQMYPELKSREDALQEARSTDADDFEEVLEDYNDFTRDLWLYHFINDTTPIYTSRIDHTDWITALRRNITFTVEDDGALWVNNARVVEANWLVSNGVMHIIDQVLNPKETDVPAPTGEATGAVAFDVDGPVESAPALMTPSLANLPDPPTATPRWSEDRADGLAQESGPDDNDAESGEGSGVGQSEGNSDRITTSGSLMGPAVAAAISVWAVMLML